MPMKTEIFGTVSHGTMLLEDLIPAFVDALEALEGETPLVVAVHTAMTDGRPYYETDDAVFDLEELFDALNDSAPSGHYFGAHPGDGGDYGLWPVDMLD